ncbi:hypothetical protein ACFOYW_15370 [Gryllotalpicola reticulitermitis]|uniref:YggT family protein n=1 Tax=Gryllotalpicola reticulitermitis TaxID=1184153 RepID=A0ABV8QAT3_9MICO
MIVTALWSVASTVVDWVLGLLPGFSVSASTGPGTILQPVAGYAADLSGWIPWGQVVIWLPLTLAFYLASFGVKILRTIITFGIG